jgi:phospholipase/lecithinase/hemolysin
MRRTLRPVLVAITALLLLLRCTPAHATDRLVIFGDSLSDVGNTYTLTGGANPPSPPYFAGRTSNGPVWVEYLAPHLGLPVPTASRLDGTNATNYAYHGASVVGGTAVPSVENQVTTYLAGNTPAPDDLFVYWGGTNDFLAGQLNATVPATAAADQIASLAAAGAKNILVLNLPPLGETPAVRNDPLRRAVANSLATTFNQTLASELGDLRATLSPDVTLTEFDVHALFTQIFANPSSFGLTNVTAPALTLSPIPTVVPNPDQYLFWDTGHPTTAAHLILASAIPEPGLLMTLLLPVSLASLRRRRHRVTASCRPS